MLIQFGDSSVADKTGRLHKNKNELFFCVLAMKLQLCRRYELLSALIDEANDIITTLNRTTVKNASLEGRLNWKLVLRNGRTRSHIAPCKLNRLKQIIDQLYVIEYWRKYRLFKCIYENFIIHDGIKIGIVKIKIAADRFEFATLYSDDTGLPLPPAENFTPMLQSALSDIIYEEKLPCGRVAKIPFRYFLALSTYVIVDEVLTMTLFMKNCRAFGVRDETEISVVISDVVHATLTFTKYHIGMLMGLRGDAVKLSKFVRQSTALCC